MEEKPLLTICVPTYNSEKFLKESLQSIVDQSYPNTQILISDNESGDNTLQIAKSFESQKVSVRHNGRKDKSQLHYLRCYDNYNGCIESGLIKGDFIAFYHSNDLYNPEIARKQMEFLIQNPEVPAVFTMGELIDGQDQVIGVSRLPKELQSKNTYQFLDVFNAVLVYGNTFLITPTLMIRKSVFKEVGLFNERDFETSADLEMWLRILQKRPIGILNENLIKKRNGGMSKKYNHLRTDTAFFFKAMDHFLQDKTLLLRLDKKRLKQYEYQRDFDNTLRAMAFLIKNEPQKAKELVNNFFSFNLLSAFFEHPTPLRAKVLALKFVLFIGINLGLGKTLGSALQKMLNR